MPLFFTFFFSPDDPGKLSPLLKKELNLSTGRFSLDKCCKLNLKKTIPNRNKNAGSTKASIKELKLLTSSFSLVNIVIQMSLVNLGWITICRRSPHMLERWRHAESRNYILGIIPPFGPQEENFSHGLTSWVGDRIRAMYRVFIPSQRYYIGLMINSLLCDRTWR